MIVGHDALRLVVAPADVDCLDDAVGSNASDAAEVLTLMEEQDRSGYRLTDEQAAEVRRRLAKKNPKYVLLDEARAKFPRSGT